GDILRPTTFGYMTMNSNGTLKFNGTNKQTITQNKLTGAGGDSLQYSKVIFENSAGFDLDGPLTVSGQLNLNNGIFNSADTIFLEKDATIAGGSNTSYIDAPIARKGADNGTSYFYPTGNGGRYAPIELHALNNSTNTYVVQYFSCPPPFGNDLAPSISSLSTVEHWVVHRPTIADSVNMTLYWSDADASNLATTADLVVAYYDAVEGWTSAGKGSETGGVGVGVSGSIGNMESCPPPFGNDLITFGGLSAAAFPVELNEFFAQQNHDRKEAILNWTTESEINASFFELERSTDAANFVLVDQIAAKGNSLTSQQYQYIDTAPAKGQNYYRLISIDEDGMRQYSRLKSVMIDVPYALSLYPNPVVNELVLRQEVPMEENGTVTVFDKEGQLIYLAAYQFEDGRWQMDVANLRLELPGMYFVKLTSSQGSEHTLPFIKTP
ncbi:MAG: T9SS type A sorting domain-containing protein, partial [Bacteroidota bacterium]